ncbi:asparagine synthase (glutamine-hydrolyzing) [Candidatus Nomurabacteria bacterium RIFCSPHIGHO2_02_FULL_33_12]|nr:MAG: asparagine synthase (glutamine-hydrolyzing) [Candidatus Nomurabacteria bacterium RIFCSPHIGHO2_02_FULL_33_12]
MCGIVGYIGRGIDQNKQVVERMNDAIFHRGPDGAGIYTDDYLGLGMRRLAIIDLISGDQPIWNNDKTKCIFFNGEIYNYKELRSEFLSTYDFKTESDTETILAMYEVFGTSTPKYLRGMFVFCIYNLDKKQLFIARDHFGIKPFYYYADGNKIFSFGSEIKAILEDERYNKNINNNAIYHYLQYQYNPLTETFFKNIFKLSPGFTMIVNVIDNSFEIKKYFDFSFNPNVNTNINQTDKEIKTLIQDSVAHHAIADVPVGSFLSGGVDSSINATLLTNHLHKPIHSFTIGASDVNEFDGAQETVDKIKSIHHKQVINKDEYMNALPSVVYHFDEPVADPSAVLLYLMAGEARKYVTVVLSGEGADEFFGGYTIYHEYYDRMKLNLVPKIIRHNILRHLAFSNFNFFGKNYLQRYFTKLSDRYIGNARLYTMKDLEKVWQGGAVEEYFNIGELYEKAKDYSEPTQMQYIDIHTWLLGDILAKADKMTMAHSLELRVPFLDIRVSTYASGLPDKLKFSHNTTKYALRNAFRGIIPTQAINRRKLGFPTQLRDWLKNDMTNFEELLINNKFIEEYISKNEIEKLINIHKNGKGDSSRKLFALYMLALWHKAFFV